MKRLSLYLFTIVSVIGVYLVIICLLPLEAIRRVAKWITRRPNVAILPYLVVQFSACALETY